MDSPPSIRFASASSHGPRSATTAHDGELRAAMAALDCSEVATYIREVTPELIRGFAEASGDAHPIHMDAAYARQTAYGKRLAHGVLMIGFMSTASTILFQSIASRLGRADISVGYDRVRFIRPVFEGDVITATARLGSTQPDRLRALCEERCTNQDGLDVAVGTHVLQFV